MRDDSKKARPANLGDDQHELFRGLRVGKRNKMEMNPVIKKIQTQLIKASHCLESVERSDNEE